MGERLVVVGGGTKGGLWTQIVSDVTGRPQDLPEKTIGTSYGDALLAARSVGLAEPSADWTNIAATAGPHPGSHSAYPAARVPVRATGHRILLFTLLPRRLVLRTSALRRSNSGLHRY